MNRLSKYVIFVMFIGVTICFFNVKDVQAADSKITCTYDGEYDIVIANDESTSTKRAKYHIVLPASKAGDVLATSNVSGYFNEGAGLTKQSHNQMQFHGLLKLKGKKCPAIYGYFSPNKVGRKLELYDSLDLCKSDGGILGNGWGILGGNTDAFCKPLVSGVYEIDGKKQCNQSQINHYREESLNFFKDINYDRLKEYKSKMDQIDLNTQDSKTIEQEFNMVFEEYTKLFNDAVNSLSKFGETYDCDISEDLQKDLDAQKGLYNTAYYPELKKYKDKLLADQIQKIKETGGDSDYLEEINKNVDKFSSDLKTELNETIQKVKDLYTVKIEQNVGKNCENILGNNLISDIQLVFDWIKIIAPILLIVFGSMDYGKAVIANDNDALKKATSNFIKRAIAAVAIFFLPYFVNLVLNLPGIKDHIQVNDPLCTVEKVVIK